MTQDEKTKNAEQEKEYKKTANSCLAIVVGYMVIVSLICMAHLYSEYCKSIEHKMNPDKKEKLGAHQNNMLVKKMISTHQRAG